MKLILKGNPLSTNQVYRSANRGGRCITYMSKKGKDLKYSYQWQARSQLFKAVDFPLPNTGDLELTVDLYFGTKRRVDVDNYNKILLDSLEGICYEDDTQIQKLIITKHYDKNNARIEVEIKEM